MNAAVKSFALHIALFVVLAALAVWAAWWLPLEPQHASAGRLGVVLALVTGVFALALKRWSVRTAPDGKQPVGFMMKVLAAVFALRFVVMGVGLVVVARRGEGELAFVVAFFSVYFLQQALEVSTVLSAHKPTAIPSEVTSS